MSCGKKSIGNSGEDLAARYLESNGYEIVARNFHSRYGEIDIIARDGERTVFVEVKRRSGVGYGSPGEAVDARKQRKIVLTALAYMQANGLLDSPIRFDVVEILPDAARHIPGAFDATGVC